MAINYWCPLDFSDHVPCYVSSDGKGTENAEGKIGQDIM
jgi:hypothetical protein